VSIVVTASFRASFMRTSWAWAASGGHAATDNILRKTVSELLIVFGVRPAFSLNALKRDGFHVDWVEPHALRADASVVAARVLRLRAAAVQQVPK
jgi:hypothetical protein